MHGIMIDCAGVGLAEARTFWSAALGLPVTDPDEHGAGRYAVLSGVHGLAVEVQIVTHPPGVHLDLAADNVDTEVARLETLGASLVSRHPSGWVVMQAPTGHRFCVVPRR